jgi:hypothetical protein
VKAFPVKSDGLSSRESSLHCGGGLFKTEKRQQQQVGRQTNTQEGFLAAPLSARCSTIMPHPDVEEDFLYFFFFFSATQGKSVSENTGTCFIPCSDPHYRVQTTSKADSNVS